MKKFLIHVILLMLVIGGALFFFNPKSGTPQIPFLPQSTQSRSLDINGSIISVEVADTQEKRSKGLGGRESLASDSGMLFVFPDSGKYPFWMKGLSFPL